MSTGLNDSKSLAATRAIATLGIAQALVYASYLIASPFLAAVMPYDKQSGAEGMGVLLTTLHGIPDAIASAARGDSPFRSPAHFVAVDGSFVALSTVLWISGLVVVTHYRDVATAAHARSIFRWTILFVAVLVLATPVGTHDLWATVVWGRMVADGVNPYYTLPSVHSDLPAFSEGNPGRTSYGPLWTLMSGSLSFVLRGNALAIAAFQKILIAACWVGAIHIVGALNKSRSAFSQCIAFIIVGWAPLGLFMAIADGHNDPMMVLPLLLWLLLLERGRAMRAGVAMGVSISIKYVSAPLLLLQLARALVSRGKDRRGMLLSVAVATSVVIAMLAVFYRSKGFLDGASRARAWQFLTPASALADVASHLGFQSPWLMPSINIAVIAATAIIAIVWLRTGSNEGFRAATLWTLTGFMLSSLGHVWPWFILWLLPLAAIQLERRIAWFVIGLTAVAPFWGIPWASLPGFWGTAVAIHLGWPIYLMATMAIVISGPARHLLRNEAPREKLLLTQ